MSVKLYMDVHAKRAVTDGLRRRGVDVLTAENPTNQSLTVSFLATQQNATGLTGYKRTINGVRSGGQGRNVNRIERHG